MKPKPKSVKPKPKSVKPKAKSPPVAEGAESDAGDASQSDEEAPRKRPAFRRPAAAAADEGSDAKAKTPELSGRVQWQ